MCDRMVEVTRSTSVQTERFSFFYPLFTRFLPAAPAKTNTNKQNPGKFTRG